MSKASTVLAQYPWLPALGLAVAYLAKEFLSTENVQDSISKASLKAQACDCLMHIHRADESQLDLVLALIDQDSPKKLPAGSTEAKRTRAITRMLSRLRPLYDPDASLEQVNYIAALLFRIQ